LIILSLSIPLIIIATLAMFINTISVSPNFKKVLRKMLVTTLVCLLTTCQASRNVRCITL
jgi:hypothetical protein